MRLWIVALLGTAFPQAQEESPEAVVAAMQARAPRFRDLELRTNARLTVSGLEGVVGASRLLLVPGTGFRTDGAILAFRDPRQNLEVEVDGSSVELGDDLYFWGTIHRGPKEIFPVIPPCLSLKGSRKDHGVTLDTFPADFPFRWVYEDAFALYALCPREAFARDPGLKSAGRKTVDGKDCHILEVTVPREKIPAGSLLGLFPVGAPVKRYLVDAESKRLRRIELEFGAGRESFCARWEAKSWREVSGVSVPDEVEAVMGFRREGILRDDNAVVRKTLALAAIDKGLSARDLLPEERRKDLHVDSVGRPVEFYTAGIERDPRNAAAYVGRAIARYREAAAALRSGGEPRAVSAESIADFEKAQAIAPSSLFVTLSLLKLYEAAGKPTELSALAQALEGQPALASDVRLALARHWVQAGNGERALRQLDAVDPSPGGPLAGRLALARLRISALSLGGKAEEGGKALADFLRSAAPPDSDFLLEVLSPWPSSPRWRGAPAPAEEDPRWTAAVEAALKENPGSALLQEMRLRSAARSGDADRVRRALETFSEAVDDPAALDRAARLALDAGGKADAPPEALAGFAASGERIAKKAPASSSAALLLGLALAKAGKAEAAEAPLAAALEAFEKEDLAPEAAEGKAQNLGLLARAFSEAGREEFVVRVCRLFIRCVNRSPRPYLLLQGDGSDPITACVAALLAKSRYVEAFNVLKELDSQKFDYLHSLRRVMLPSEQAFLKAVKEEVLSKSGDPGDLRKLAKLIQRTTSKPQEAIPLLEKAREAAPGDVTVLQELAQLCMGLGGDRDRAIGLYEELVAALEKTPSPKIDRDHAIYMIAQLQQMMGRIEKAAAALDRMDLEAPSVAGTLMSVAAIYEQAGRTERAIAAYRRFLDRHKDQPYLATSGTYGRLGALYEETGQFDEAFRAYTRGIEAQRRERERGIQGGVVVLRPGQGRPEPTDPAVRREALMRRLGENYFLEQFLERPVEALSPEDERRARECFEKLRSDSVTDREEAEAAIRKMGPRVAPLLKAGLQSSDPEFRARVRQILVEWSEPR